MRTELDEEERRKLDHVLAERDIGRTDKTESGRLPFDLQDLPDPPKDQRPLQVRETQKLREPEPVMAVGAPKTREEQPVPPETTDPAREAREGKGNDVDWLGAIAAFTQNPVLAEKVRRRDAEAAGREESQQKLRLARNADAREQQKFELERDLMAPLRAQKLSGDLVLQSAKGSQYIAGTPAAKAMREAMSSGLEARAVAVEKTSPMLAQQIRGAAKNIAVNDSLSALDLDRMGKNPTFGAMVQPILAQAHNAATEAIAKAQIGLGWAKEHENERSNKENEDIKRSGLENQRAALEQRAARGDQKAAAELADLNVQSQLFSEAKEQQKHVWTGKIPAMLQRFGQKFGLETKAFDTLESTLANVNNAIGHAEFGGTLTKNEADALREQLPKVDMGDDQFAARIETILHTIELKARGAKGRMRGGQALPAAAAPSSVQPPPQNGQNISSRFKIGDTATNPKTGERSQWDGRRWVLLKQ